ncbi:MAG: hypothetical protein DRN15_11565 [Thermoprotei archaeon]|nr:MAG: hypothetical protein DRN15_11565 [Thermoprotei archaeon]
MSKYLPDRICPTLILEEYARTRALSTVPSTVDRYLKVRVSETYRNCRYLRETATEAMALDRYCRLTALEASVLPRYLTDNPVEERERREWREDTEEKTRVDRAEREDILLDTSICSLLRAATEEATYARVLCRPLSSLLTREERP